MGDYDHIGKGFEGMAKAAMVGSCLSCVLGGIVIIGAGILFIWGLSHLSITIR